MPCVHRYIAPPPAPLPPEVRLPMCLQLKDVMWEFLRSRRAQTGEPLNRFRTIGGITAAGVVDWAKGCYRIALSEAGDYIVTLTHRSSAQADLSSHKLTADYELRENWLDYNACLVKPPLPPLRLHVFFGKNEGPHAYQHFGSRNKAFEDMCEDVEAKWRQAKDDACKGGAQDIERKSGLAALAERKKQQQVAASREKAKATLAEKKRKKVIKLKA